MCVIEPKISSVEAKLVTRFASLNEIVPTYYKPGLTKNAYLTIFIFEKMPIKQFCTIP